MRTRIVLALLAVAMLPLPAHAAPGDEALTWSVAPSGPQGPNGRANLTYKLDPGAGVTDHVAVTNHSTRPLTLRLYANDAFTTAGGGFGLRAGDGAPTGAGLWIGIGRERLTLPASSRVVVPITVTVPANATPGDHAAGVVASLVADGTDGQGNRVTVDHRVGTRLHLRVTGPLRPELSVTDVRITTATPWNPLRLPRVAVSFTIKNTGNVRLRGTSVAGVRGPFSLGGRASSAVAVPELLPGAVLSTTVTVDEVPPLFRERVTVEIHPEPADGRAVDPAPVRASSVHTVWLIPWPQLALLLVVALLAAVWLFARRRRGRRMRAALAAAEQRGREQAGSGAGASSAGQNVTPGIGSGQTSEKEGER